MKKILALLMTLMLILSALALPALAEETTDTTTAATEQPGNGGHGSRMPGNGNMPQMPGQNDGQNGQIPQTPEQNSGQSRQIPQMPGQNSRNEHGFGKGGRKGIRGNSAFINTDKLEAWLAQLVTDGVITQDVSDAILAYAKAQTVQADATASTNGTEPPALPGVTVPAEGSEAPALPDNAAPAESPEARLLKEMLDEGVITQEQYDEFLSRIAVPEAAETETAGT